MNCDFDDSRPIYMQVSEKLEKKILQGQYHPGQKILKSRELALKLTVNPNIIEKALVELEKTGLIYTDRDKDIIVTEDIQLICDTKIEKTFTMANEFIIKVKELSINKEEKDRLMQKIKEELNE